MLTTIKEYDKQSKFTNPPPPPNKFNQRRGGGDWCAGPGPAYENIMFTKHTPP